MVYLQIAADRLDGELTDRITENALARRYDLGPAQLATAIANPFASPGGKFSDSGFNDTAETVVCLCLELTSLELLKPVERSETP